MRSSFFCPLTNGPLWFSPMAAAALFMMRAAKSISISSPGSPSTRLSTRFCACAPEDAPDALPKKHRFLAMENSFHGRTFGAISVTATEKYRLPFAPVVPGVEFVRFNDLADLEAKFDESVCAVFLETIQGEGGIYPVSDVFWNRARALATERGALLIADEIQCGLGRTGRYFAYQKFASKPDIALVAKPLAAGLPLAAILTTEAVASRVSPRMHVTTFGGGPLVCATTLA